MELSGFFVLFCLKLLGIFLFFFGVILSLTVLGNVLAGGCHVGLFLRAAERQILIMYNGVIFLKVITNFINLCIPNFGTYVDCIKCEH